jgi:hypothetical protein
MRGALPRPAAGFLGAALLAAGLLSFSACDSPLGKGNSPASPSRRDFWAYDLEKKEAYRCRAALLAEGTRCLVYGEEELGAALKVHAATAERVAREFDLRIYPLTDYFGKPLDVDGNGKVILLLLDIRDGYDPQSSPGYVAGYFDPGDMYLPGGEGASGRGNGADMLYIDIRPGTIGSSASYVNIAHEFQHLLSFSRRAELGSPLDLWIDEGLSTAAEYLYGGHQRVLVDWLLDPRNLTAPRGNTFYIWNGDWEDYDSYTNYSTVYLFFQWLRIHADNHEGIYREILDSPEGDYRALTRAASRHIQEDFQDWEKLLGTWFMANLLQESGGRRGYGGEFSFEPWYLRGELPDPNRIKLAPGEGVYSRSLSGEPPAEGNIRYGTGLRASREYLLTYNANSNNRFADIGELLETGQVGAPAEGLPGYASPSGRSLLAGEDPEPYIRDGARYFRENRKGRVPRWPPSR